MKRACDILARGMITAYVLFMLGVAVWWVLRS